MRPDETTEPITIRAAKDVVRGIKALALATAYEGRVRPVDDALADLAIKHGFAR